MRRPWQIWLTFAACLAVVLSAMGWVSLTVLRLDREQARARREAELDERIRLALRRMDFEASLLIARESDRPYPYYNAFYFAGKPYTRMYVEILKDEVLLPSPLLTGTQADVLLHFQLEPDGELTSPQVPTGNAKDVVESKNYASADDIAAAAARLDTLRDLVDAAALRRVASGPTFTLRAPTRHASTQTDTQQQTFTAFEEQQRKLNWDEAFSRAQSVQSLQETARVEAANTSRFLAADAAPGTMRPVWMSRELLLVRKLTVGEDAFVQGCWLDWDRIRRTLLTKVSDLMPKARLEPVAPGHAGSPERRLTALPVRLVPGETAAADGDGLSPIVLSLGLAWACVLVAGGAVAMLLSGAVSLSERRGAFVSAVTHEMRTPLTTFRMYTEMLEGDMVTDASRRKEYLGTLRTEAERLGHLVENVLAYARLERGSARGRIASVALGEVVLRAEPLLRARADRAGMTLVVENGVDVDAAVRADAAAVEQILFNLVDNACKYAASAADRRIHVRTRKGDGAAELRVCDHGPGVARTDLRRLFRPFSKSARDAANTAPGVGLGLALSRRLARQMHGELALDAGAAEGACFVLTLPLA